MDGRPWVMEWRESTHLYNYGEDTYPLDRTAVNKSLARSRRSKQKLLSDNGRACGPYLLTRHLELSDDIGYRFSNRTWSSYPLYADTYANWIAHTSGDFLLLGWDFETFGEHHRRDSGIFEFMQALPSELARRRVHCRTPSAIIEQFSTSNCAHHLPLPTSPTTWAGNGGIEFFLGNSAQQTIFQLMGHVYGMAKLTENPDLLDLATWLAQSDNLHLIQWFGRSGPEAEVSTYFTPNEWWSLGANGIIHEQQQVYLNALHAIEPYLPARLIHQAKRSPSSKLTRRKREPEVNYMARHI